MNIHFRFYAALCAATLVGAQAQAALDKDAQIAVEKVSEGANIDPRTGSIRLSGKSDAGYIRAYACPSFAAARKVVSAIPASDERRGEAAQQVSAMRIALRRQGCAPAKGTFRLIAAGPEVLINHGYEAEEYWLALKAVNIHGKDLGLIFDTSPYAPLQ